MGWMSCLLIQSIWVANIVDLLNFRCSRRSNGACGLFLLLWIFIISFFLLLSIVVYVSKNFLMTSNKASALKSVIKRRMNRMEIRVTSTQFDWYPWTYNVKCIQRCFEVNSNIRLLGESNLISFIRATCGAFRIKCIWVF